MSPFPKNFAYPSPSTVSLGMALGVGKAKVGITSGQRRNLKIAYLELFKYRELSSFLLISKVPRALCVQCTFIN